MGSYLPAHFLVEKQCQFLYDFRGMGFLAVFWGGLSGVDSCFHVFF